MVTERWRVTGPTTNGAPNTVEFETDSETAYDPADWRFYGSMMSNACLATWTRHKAEMLGVQCVERWSGETETWELVLDNRVHSS